MISINRPKKAPASLTGPHSAGKTELAINQARLAVDPNAKLTFTAYKGEDVRLTLNRMFMDKCAYCEARFAANSDGAVEHYRPKGRMKSVAHPGYWWLAAQWTNLLLTCQHCNEVRQQIIVTFGMSMEQATRLQRKAGKKPTHGKGTQFPIRGTRGRPTSNRMHAEDALLIDPTRKNPRQHLHFPPDTGISLAVPVDTPSGRDPYGLATINVTALNRFHLVRERTGLLMDLRRHVLELASGLDAAAAATNAGSEAAARERCVRAMAAIEARAAPNRPYSSVAFDLHQRLEKWMRDESHLGIEIPTPLLIDNKFL